MKNKQLKKTQIKKELKKIRKAEYEILVLKKKIKKENNYKKDLENNIKHLLKFTGHERNIDFIEMFNNNVIDKEQELFLLQKQLKDKLNTLNELYQLKQEYLPLKIQNNGKCSRIESNISLEKQKKKLKRKELKKIRKAAYLVSLEKKKQRKKEKKIKEEELKLMRGFETYEELIFYKEQEAFDNFLNYIEKRNKNIKEKEKFEKAICDADYRKKF